MADIGDHSKDFNYAQFSNEYDPSEGSGHVPAPGHSYEAPPQYPGPPPTDYGYDQPMHSPGGSNQSRINTDMVVVHQPCASTTIEREEICNPMPLAIFTTLCCCLILGIIAIVKASESRSALSVFDFQRAKEAAKASTIVSISAIVVGLPLTVLVIVYRLGYIG